jgi:hypothetical protein
LFEDPSTHDLTAVKFLASEVVRASDCSAAAFSEMDVLILEECRKVPTPLSPQATARRK